MWKINLSRFSHAPYVCPCPHLSCLIWWYNGIIIVILQHIMDTRTTLDIWMIRAAGNARNVPGRTSIKLDWMPIFATNATWNQNSNVYAALVRLLEKNIIKDIWFVSTNKLYNEICIWHFCYYHCGIFDTVVLREMNFSIFFVFGSQCIMLFFLFCLLVHIEFSFSCLVVCVCSRSVSWILLNPPVLCS